MTWVDSSNVALLTDFYELTMTASYHARGMESAATFDLFVRDLPPDRNFLIACGLEQALDYLEELRFGDDEVEYLRSLGAFSEDFLDYLSGFRFTGEVWAMREGEAVFPGEPLLRVTGPLVEAQIVETFLLNCIAFQTMIASKAARVAIASDDRDFVDFSPRRDHGADAALKAARASYVAGASATSNVLAGRMYGIPVSGTMAHSYVLAFPSEIEAFRAFARDFPDRAVFLIDTFDVDEGARRAAAVAHELAGEGIRVRGVRIDSGDLVSSTHAVRKILDDARLKDVAIVLSGDLDEYRIEELLRADVPASSFGVGTQLGTSGDAPALGAVYKLVAQDGEPKMKLSSGKLTLPGRKQVYRFSAGGSLEHDLIALEDEPVDAGTPLLRQVMANGRRTDQAESLDAIRVRCEAALASLPRELRSLRTAETAYRVELSAGLEQLCAQIQSVSR